MSSVSGTRTRWEASSYRSPLLDLPGAVSAGGIDTGVALHYGDPLGEQRALATGVGFVDVSHRTALDAWGEDRLPWLHRLTSQQLSDLPPCGCAQALILSPDGYIEHHIFVTELGGSAWIWTEPGRSGPLLDYLDSMRHTQRVEVRDVTADWAAVSLVGPEVGQVLAHFGVVEPPRPFTVVSLAGGGWLWRLPISRGDITALVVPRGLLPHAAKQLSSIGVRPAGMLAYEGLRLAVRGPRLGFEIDDHTLPQEVGWLEAMVSLDRSCYRGKQGVARVQETGRPPRRLVLLRLNGPAEALPPHGAPVVLGGRPVGFVGTAAPHFDLGPVALALVARDVPDDSALSAGDVPASIEPAQDEPAR